MVKTNQLVSENSQKSLDLDGSIFGTDKRYRLHGKRFLEENLSKETGINKRYRLHGKRDNEDTLESASDSNEELLEKRYRLMGK